MIIRTMYKVKEIFKSIQGEGFHSGKTAVFIRFSGCNLWNGIEKFRKRAKCNFCDTDFVEKTLNKASISDINSIKDVVDVDTESRRIATEFITNYTI